MPSLNLDLNFFDHPKVKRLRALIGPEAEIYIIRLWAYAGKFHSKDGILKGYSGPEIEGLAEWKGNPGIMLQAMLTVGFIESGNKIHDWAEHEGHLMIYKARAQAASLARWKNRPLVKNASSSPKGIVKESPISSVHCSSVHGRALTTIPEPAKAVVDGLKPVNWENCRTDLQRVIATFIRVGNPTLYAPGACTQAQAAAIFKVQGNPAAAILTQCGDCATACRAVELAGAYFQSKGLDWSLHAVSRNCADYLSDIIKEKNYAKK